jgi:cytochrome c551/c552
MISRKKGFVVKKALLIFTISSVTLFAANLGETLFNGNCTSCHNIITPNSAPSIQEIKQYYTKAFPQKDAFVLFMSEWVSSPDTKTAIMPHAIKKYGLMPELGYDKDTLTEISKYIFETNFKK